MAKFAGPHEHTCWGTSAMTLGSHLAGGSIPTSQISTRSIQPFPNNRLGNSSNSKIRYTRARARRLPVSDSSKGLD